jgi:predicted TPR repeat methyltransferase
VARDTSDNTRKVQGYFDARKADYDAFYEPPSAFGRWFNRVFRKAVYLRRDQALLLAKRYGCRTVLDVGCGTGRNAIWWAHQGLERLHGVDISQEMIGEARALAARANLGDRCTFEFGNFMTWTTDRRYDLVVACGVFDYVTDAAALLGHMSEFADKVVYGSFPGWTLVRTPLRKVRYALRGCPTHFYRRHEIERAFENAGLGVCELKAVPSGYLAWAVKGQGAGYGV